MDKSDHDSKQFGRRLSLGEIEDFRKSSWACPECKSTEGFWFITKRESTFFQCKHCAVISEASKVFADLKEPKHFKLVIKLRR
jgi:ribosomal protein L37AE/L43A